MNSAKNERETSARAATFAFCFKLCVDHLSTSNVLGSPINFLSVEVASRSSRSCADRPYFVLFFFFVVKNSAVLEILQRLAAEDPRDDHLQPEALRLAARLQQMFLFVPLQCV